jgi:hypothetical protein
MTSLCSWVRFSRFSQFLFSFDIESTIARQRFEVLARSWHRVC